MGAELLLVEDDPGIGEGLAAALRAQGEDVRWVTTGAGAIAAVREHPPSIVLLDLGLPDMDGIDLCRHLRELAPAAGIIAVTARAAEVDVVVGLDAGADDYVVKPFRLAELLARLRAQRRRLEAAGGADAAVRVGELEVDRASHRVLVSGVEVALRPREFDLLALLAAEAGRAVTRERIIDLVWDQNWYGSTKTLDVHIMTLRRKLASAGSEQVTITTLRGVGYRLETG